jgi:hypothetical protein
MKEARIEIIGHDGEVDQKVLDSMARNIRELLNQGFEHDTSITIGSCSFGVFTKDAEVAVSTAPTTEPTKRPPLSEWPQYVLEINRTRLIDQQYTIGRVWNIAGYVMDWHGCNGELRITESINELFELLSAVQDVLTNAGIAISVHGQGLNHHVTRRAFVEQIAEIICEQAKGIGQDAATTAQEAPDLTPIDPNMISGINKAYAQIERQRKEIYRLTMNNSDLESCIRQIHDDSLIKAKFMGDREFRSHAYKLTTHALANLRPHDESRSALDHQPDSVFEGIMGELKDIASDVCGWKDLENSPIPDGDFDAFWSAVEKRYNSVPSGDAIYIKGTQLEYLESIAKAIIVLNAKDLPSEGKSLLDRVIDVACDYFGWKGNLDDAMRISDNNLDGFLDTVTRKLNMFGGNMATINHYVDKGYTRMKFLREIAIELYEGKK